MDPWVVTSVQEVGWAFNQSGHCGKKKKNSYYARNETTIPQLSRPQLSSLHPLHQIKHNILCAAAKKLIHVSNKKKKFQLCFSAFSLHWFYKTTGLIAF